MIVHFTLKTYTSALNYSLQPTGLTNSNGQFSNLAAGTFTVVVSDVNNCSVTSIVALTQPTVLAMNCSSTSVLCYGDYATITVNSTGGTPNYVYSINGGTYQTSNQFPGVNAGTYTLQVKDANNCTVSQLYTIIQPTILTLTLSSDSIGCYGGNATITSNAGGGTTPYQYSLNGSAFQTSNVFGGLPAGTYTVSVKDANNCLKTSTIIINQPSLLQVTAAAGSILCYGESTNITATGSGGASGYTYSLNGSTFQSSNTFSAVLAGVYTVGVKDGNNCTSSTSITISQPLLLTDAANATTILCQGGSATISIVGTGGIPAYSYSLDGVTYQSSPSFSNQPASTYTVFVKDANNCTATTVLQITEPTALLVTASANPILCFGGNTTITTTATGGTGSYSYSLNNSPYQASGNFGNVSVGSYTILVKDANNCTASTTLIISQPTVLVIDSVQTTVPTCIPGNDGSISLFASGGTTGYTYSIGGGWQSSSLFTGLAAGAYTVQVQDAHACSLSSAVIIVAPNSPVFTSVTTTDVNCFNESNGAIQVTATGGIGQIEYTLQPGSFTNTTGSFVGLSAGMYTITAKDANNCTVSTSILLNQPNVLSVTASSGSIACFGGKTTISVNGSGGSPSYQYNINGGAYQNTGTFTNSSAGIYTIGVVDAHNCTATTTIEILQPGNLTLALSATTILCYNGTATISAIATGGTPFYSYSLNGSVYQPSASFANVTAGNYTVIVKDANNCTLSSTILLTQPSVLIIDSLQFTTPTCIPGNDGSISVFASGATPVYQYSAGSGYQLSNTLNGLSPATYTISVTDANGCSATSTITISAPNAPNFVSMNTSLVSCFGGNDGSIQTTATGGTGTISYTLQPGGTTNTNGNFGSLTAGNYTITISDASNCTATSITTIYQPSQLGATLSATPILCFGGTASITVTASGGTLPSYQYSLNGGGFQTWNVYNNLPAASYTVTVYDGNNCTTQTSMVITQPQALTLSLSASAIACNGGTSTITATVSGGTSSFEYSLNGSAYQSSNTFTNVGIGVYQVTVKDANGCTKSAQITINQPGVLTIDSLQSTTPTCLPGNDGTITVFASGGTPAYLYSSGGASQTANQLIGLAAGTYTVTVTDFNGCSATQTMTIYPPNAPVIDSIITQDVSCFAGNDGSISAYASAGFGLFTYTLNPVSVSNSNGQFSSLNAGSYTITVTDDNHCTVSTIAVINEPMVLSTTLTSGAILCNGGSTSITANATGGTMPYQYSLNALGYQSNPVFSGNVAGIYTITVLDAHNCSATSTIELIQPSVLAVSLTASSIACYGGSTSITASASGGTLGYSYSLNGSAFQSSNQFSSITPGTYTILVLDANNCSVTSSINITQPALLQLDSSIYTTPTCIPGNDGTITVFASGGTPSYQYNVGGSNQSSNQITNLGSGTYTITVTDFNGCTITGIQIVLPPSSPTIDSTSLTNISCFGGSNGSIDVSASGGLGQLNYTLQPGNITNTNGAFNNLVAGTYTVTVMDVNNCTVTTSSVLTQPSPVLFTSTSTDSVNCFGESNGAIQVTANGGTGLISYTLQPGGVGNTTGIFANLTTGSYTVNANDANGCSLSTSVVVATPSALSISSVTHTDETCNNTQDGSILISAIGGSGILNYTLQPSSQTNTNGTFNNLSGNTYTILVSDAHGCTLTTSIVVINPQPIAFTSLTHTDVLCAGNANGTISASGTGGNPGGYTYTLQPGNVSNTNGYFNGLPTGTYTVTVRDVKNCSISSTVIILTPSPIVFTLVSTKDATCNGVANGEVYTSITGGTGPYTYVIQPGSITNNIGDFTNVPADIFTLTVTDANGCSSSIGPIIINQPPAIVLTLLSKKDVTCYGGNDGNMQITTSGGTGIKTVSISPNIGTFTAPGFFDNLSSAVYTVTAQDANGCTATSTVFINQNPPLLFDSLLLVSPTCHGDADGQIQAFASGGSGTIYYQLNGGLSNINGLFTGLTAGTYTLNINDQLGCFKDSLIQLTEPDPIDFFNIDIKSAECGDNKNGRIIISGMGGNGDYTYILRPYIRINKFGVFNDLDAGIYTITIKDYKGCLKDTVVEVNPPGALMSLDIEKNNLGCFGLGTEGWAKVNVTNGTPPYSYTWSTVPVQTTETATGLYFGWYFVDVVDARGCKEKDTVYIEPGPCCEEVFIPNAFTPNGDGLNDVFRVVTSAGIELIQFAIYNRWGNRVWSSPDFRRAWDGREGGRIEDGNTYYYIFRYKCLTDGNTYIKKGDVTVMP